MKFDTLQANLDITQNVTHYLKSAHLDEVFVEKGMSQEVEKISRFFSFFSEFAKHINNDDNIKRIQLLLLKDIASNDRIFFNSKIYGDLRKSEKEKALFLQADMAIIKNTTLCDLIVTLGFQRMNNLLKRCAQLALEETKVKSIIENGKQANRKDVLEQIMQELENHKVIFGLIRQVHMESQFCVDFLKEQKRQLFEFFEKQTLRRMAQEVDMPNPEDEIECLEILNDFFVGIATGQPKQIKITLHMLFGKDFHPLRNTSQRQKNRIRRLLKTQEHLFRSAMAILMLKHLDFFECQPLETLSEKILSDLNPALVLEWPVIHLSDTLIDKHERSMIAFLEMGPIELTAEEFLDSFNDFLDDPH